MGLFSMVFNYLPLLLALYSAWSSGGGYTPLLQFVVTIFAGKMLNSAFTYILQIAFLGAHPLVLAQVMLFPAGIYVIAYFLGCSMHMLGSYALSCFVFPAIRRKAPTAGTPAIAVAILAGVAYVWQTDGISSFFVFILFLQVLPELQRPLWIGGPTKTKLHFALLAVTTLLFAPFATLGAVAVSKPELLTSLSEGQLRTLCAVSNGCPSVDHRDLYAALGLHKYAPISDVRKAYRRLSLENHPDKLVELNLTQEEKEAKVAAFTRAATAYETLSKPGAPAHATCAQPLARAPRRPPAPRPWPRTQARNRSTTRWSARSRASGPSCSTSSPAASRAASCLRTGSCSPCSTCATRPRRRPR